MGFGYTDDGKTVTFFLGQLIFWSRYSLSLICVVICMIFRLHYLLSSLVLACLHTYLSYSALDLSLFITLVFSVCLCCTVDWSVSVCLFFAWGPWGAHGFRCFFLFGSFYFGDLWERVQLTLLVSQEQVQKEWLAYFFIH